MGLQAEIAQEKKKITGRETVKKELRQREVPEPEQGKKMARLRKKNPLLRCITPA